MTQVDAVWTWWAGLDDVDRGRVLRLTDDQLLPEDLFVGLAMHGVPVTAADVSPVDGQPAGYFPPAVSEDLLQCLRRPCQP
ncbi:hypothetical protein [Kineococcus rubinsiae]|uniref:hypothetical protein n=1 Tax=Kineococcus rubinsiae TaxID=2609562 RepID=UPI0014304034|nr:hypothetical protein [Kineococcus rubinsiae]NIZ89649.1 hypothetical protein [Kineococcus rubinsiae]